MKKMVFVFIILFQTVGCVPKIYPLKGIYPDKPFEGISSSPKEKVWDRVIDFFSQNGLSIRIIDKSSGLIISGATVLSATNEDNFGMLLNKKASVVYNQIYDPGTRKIMKPTSVAGEWNVRIKDSEGGKTIINVNLVNVVCYVGTTSGVVVNMSQSGNAMNNSKFTAKSTGVFEKNIFDIIK